MTCADVRLDEYLDGELAAPDRSAVDAHLADCAGCRAELDRSKRLEALLHRAAPAGGSPDADRFVAVVRDRSRRSAWARLAGGLAAAAAALLVALMVRPAAPAADARALLAQYARTPSPELEASIRKAGAPGLELLEKALEDPDVKTQFAAATLLFRLLGEADRDRLFARLQKRAEPPAPPMLVDLVGLESGDEEMVPVVVSLALDGQKDVALDALRRLHRINRLAQARIIDSVVTLLKSDMPKVQQLALEIVKELDLEFPLSAIVGLLDSPELGDKALEKLREATGKDFGKDQEAWRKAVQR
jgi:hypothetical protein